MAGNGRRRAGIPRAIELNPNLGPGAPLVRRLSSAPGPPRAGDCRISRARAAGSALAGSQRHCGIRAVVSSPVRRGDGGLGDDQGTGSRYPYTHVFYGHAYAVEGRYAEAVAAYQRAIALGLDTPTTQILPGRRYARGGNRARALGYPGAIASSQVHVSAAELAILLTALASGSARSPPRTCVSGPRDSTAVPGGGTGFRSIARRSPLSEPPAEGRPGVMTGALSTG